MGLTPHSRDKALSNPTEETNITGRQLNQKEIDLIDSIREHEARLGGLLTTIENQMAEHGDREAGRWLAEARTCLETGFMFAVKAVARPSNGLGRKAPK